MIFLGSRMCWWGWWRGMMGDREWKIIHQISNIESTHLKIQMGSYIIILADNVDLIKFVSVLKDIGLLLLSSYTIYKTTQISNRDYQFKVNAELINLTSEYIAEISMNYKKDKGKFLQALINNSETWNDLNKIETKIMMYAFKYPKFNSVLSRKKQLINKHESVEMWIKELATTLMNEINRTKWNWKTFASGAHLKGTPSLRIVYMMKVFFEITYCIFLVNLNPTVIVY